MYRKMLVFTLLILFLAVTPAYAYQLQNYRFSTERATNFIRQRQDYQYNSYYFNGYPYRNGVYSNGYYHDGSYHEGYYRDSDQIVKGFDPNRINFRDHEKDLGYGGYHKYRRGKYYGRDAVQTFDGEVKLGHERTFTRNGEKITVFYEDTSAPKIGHDVEGHDRFNRRGESTYATSTFGRKYRRDGSYIRYAGWR